MKALCVKQPWAFLLIDAVKTLEVRSWSTEYRGDLLICASASPKNEFWKDTTASPEALRVLPSGCMHGVVLLRNVRKMTKEDAWEGGAFCDYQENSYVWEIEVPEYRPCRPDKIIGRLNLFDVPDEKIIMLRKGDDFFNYPAPQGEVKFSQKCNVL